MFDIQNIYQASSATEAVRLLAAHPEARLICGGTDVLVKLRHFDEAWRNLVDIHAVPELKEVVAKRGRLFLGAGLTFAEVMQSPTIQEHLPVLAEACGTVAGPQIRNMGTIGGNIAGGAVSADTAAPMLLLEPDILIEGPGGRRAVSILGFHAGPGRVALNAGEVLLGFDFNLKALKGLSARYYKYAMRSAMDIATVGCAAGVRLEGDTMADLRLALTVAAPTPIRCPAAEEAGRGRRLNAATMKSVLAALETDIRPRTSWRASREFRTRIIKTLAERLIHAAAGGEELEA